MSTIMRASRIETKERHWAVLKAVQVQVSEGEMKKREKLLAQQWNLVRYNTHSKS